MRCIQQFCGCNDEDFRSWLKRCACCSTVVWVFIVFVWSLVEGVQPSGAGYIGEIYYGHLHSYSHCTLVDVWTEPTIQCASGLAALPPFACLCAHWNVSTPLGWREFAQPDETCDGQRTTEQATAWVYHTTGFSAQIDLQECWILAKGQVIGSNDNSILLQPDLDIRYGKTWFSTSLSLQALVGVVCFLPALCLLLAVGYLCVKAYRVLPGRAVRLWSEASSGVAHRRRKPAPHHKAEATEMTAAAAIRPPDAAV